MLDVTLDQLLEFLSNMVAFESDVFLAINVNRCYRPLTGVRQAYANIGMLGLSRPIHHTPHHSNIHILHTWMSLAPPRHLLTQIALYVFGQLLNIRTRGTPASWSRNHPRGKCPQP